MTKEERLQQRVDVLDNNRLKDQVKLVNASGVSDKIRLVGLKKLDMVNAFTLAVEAIAEAKGEEAIPDSCSNLYNDLHTDDKSPLDVEPEKKAPAKKSDKTKTDSGDGSGKKKEGPPKQPVDEYGTRKGTLAYEFVQQVKKNPQSMEDVRKADWNPRGYHFNDTLRRLVADKLATVDEKTGVINIK